VRHAAQLIGAARLVNALLPATWRDRRAALLAASELDVKHGAAAAELLLDAWSRWHRTGEVPPAGPLRDVVAVLVELLGGVAHELRRRPRCAANDTHHASGARAAPSRGTRGRG
jgi:hypothetical protein